MPGRNLILFKICDFIFWGPNKILRVIQALGWMFYYCRYAALTSIERVGNGKYRDC